MIIKLKKIILIPLKYSLALITISFLFLLSLVRTIRIAEFPATFGNLVVDPVIYYYLKKKKKELLKNIDLFYLQPEDTYNKFLLNFWKKKLIIFPYFFIKPVLNLHKILHLNFIRTIPEMSIYHPQNVHENIQKKKIIKFSSDEEKLGESILKKNFGIKPGQKFVCLNVRDGNYKRTLFKDKQLNFSKNNFRDWDINIFKKSLSFLSKKNIYVLRMGVYPKAKIKFSNKKIIDYANSKLRSDFMDVYLASKCFFCISTGSGFDELCTVFNKPVLDLTMPLGSIKHWQKSIFLFQKHYSKKKKRNLTLKEIFKYGYAWTFDSKKFRDSDIILKKNSADEIFHATKEILILLSNKKAKFLNTKKQKIFKNKYIKYWKQFSNNQKIFNSMNDKEKKMLKIIPIKFKSYLSTFYLNKNSNFIK